MSDTVAVPARRSRVASIFVGDDGLRAGWSLLIFAALIIGLSFAMVRIMHAVAPDALAVGGGMTPRGTIIQEVLSLLLVGIAAFVMSLIERRRFFRYNLTGPDRLRDFVKGLASGLGALSVLVGLLYVAGGISFSGLAIGGAAIPLYAVEWLAAFLLVGLFEEFAFRGYLQFTLARGVAGFARALGTSAPRAVLTRTTWRPRAWPSMRCRLMPGANSLSPS